MTATVTSLFRHPVKGLTPEALDAVDLVAGAHFPNDRRYAVEVGPSGFDPEKPGHVSKMKFTVLARFPMLARLKTELDDATGLFRIGDAAGFGVETRLDTDDGREALARFLQAFLGAEATGRLHVFDGEDSRHRFMDHPKGFMSVINLASVRAVEKALGRPVDPLRFRANVYVDGLPAWAEDGLVAEAPVRMGGARLKVFKPIVRCVATHVNLETGERDIDMVDELRTHFGRDTLGTYFSIVAGGRVARGDGLTGLGAEGLGAEGKA
jgi:uncharacterized protein